MYVEGIKAALRKQGWTRSASAKELDIGPSTVSHALTRQRSRWIEQVITSKLDLSPHEIWPQRYKRGKVSHAPICQQTGSAIQALKLSSTTLRRYRVQEVLIEGIHWVRVNSRCIRYNLELIQDWLHNRHAPIAHQRAIHIYQFSLLSSQRKSFQRVSSKQN